MNIAQSKIVMFILCLLLWTLVMSLAKVIFGNELNVTDISIIIFWGVIVASVTVLARHIVKMTQSKIASFFAYLLLWTLVMSFGRIISGQELNAINIGIFIVGGVIVASVSVLARHISQKSPRR